jgi:hypothetical protein
LELPACGVLGSALRIGITFPLLRDSAGSKVKWMAITVAGSQGQHLRTSFADVAQKPGFVELRH